MVHRSEIQSRRPAVSRKYPASLRKSMGFDRYSAAHLRYMGIDDSQARIRRPRGYSIRKLSPRM